MDIRLFPDSTGQIKRLLLFTTLLGWCAVLLMGRVFHARAFTFSFLVWNLFLAVVPFLAAWLFARAAERRAAAIVQLSCFALWLAFLPNAPYLITDFVHLRARPPVPLWYDIALLGSFAGTGLLLGYSSLAEVQMVVSKKFSTMLGWIMAFGALLLSGFGIYLGRFLGWNSWDVVTNPFQVFFHIAYGLVNPTSHPRAVAFSLVYGFALLLGYVALRVFHSSDRSQVIAR